MKQAFSIRFSEALALYLSVLGCAGGEPSDEVAAALPGGGAPNQEAPALSSMPGVPAASASPAQPPPCSGANCVCPQGQSSCLGSLLGANSDSATCVSLGSDAANCGGCGVICALGQVCNAGVCSAACGVGLTQCDTACADTRTDAQNCGGCGLACGAGQCVNGACPPGKACALKKEVVAPGLADFETYVAGAAPETFGFSFNAAPGTPLAVYAGPYQYSDGTGAQALAMVPGNMSNYAASISNTGASVWGGGLGFWMGCIDASSYDGIAFSIRGQVPGGSVTLSTPTESTSAPAVDDPNAGGTCLAGCVAPTAPVPVTAEWQRVVLPWSAFAPGTADQATLPVSGDGITGLSFAVALEWAEVPGAAGTYGPVSAPYELAVDDIAFFRTTELCAAGQVVCDSGCVDLVSSNDHCGACGNACTGGSTCAGERGCACPDGLTFCGGSCVDVATDTSHCGACGNFCAIGAACNAGQCSGDAGTTSNRCGQPTRRLGNPFGCEFGWGANPDFAPQPFVTFATKWVGYEPDPARCDGCTWLSSFNGTDVIPTYIAYFTAFRANTDAGLGDCNLDFDGNNLCTGGAQFIRSNRARLISIYASYARGSYAIHPNGPVLWIIEPDFIQYTGGTNALSMQELGQFASDIMCAIKSNMPNAVIALNHSTWTRDAELRSYWQNMPLDLIDMVHVTSMANVPGGYFNDYDAIGRDDGTFRFLSQLTGKPLLADTSFGITTQEDSWSTGNAATLNARIAEGVVGALIYPTPNAYEQRINGLRPQLGSTCE